MSASSADNLVHMANQIAAFFESQPGDKAAAEIAAHLKAFWPPAMRQAIGDHLQAGGQGLSVSAQEAIRLLMPANGG
jgi:formate dehydrogenase subunit delta